MTVSAGGRMQKEPRAAPDPSGLVRLFRIAVWSGLLVAVPLTLLLVFSGGPYGAMLIPVALLVSQALGAFLMLVYGCWQVIVARLRPAVFGLALAAYLLPSLLVVGALRLSFAPAEGADLDAYMRLLELGFPFLVLQLVGLRLARALRNRPPLVLAGSFVAPLLLGVAAYAVVLARDVTASMPWRHRRALHLDSMQWEEGSLIMEGVLTNAEELDENASIWARYDFAGGSGGDAESVEWPGELDAPRPREGRFFVPRGVGPHPLRIRWEYCDLGGPERGSPCWATWRGSSWHIALGLREERREGEKRFDFPAPPPPDHACVSIWDWQPVVEAELMFSVRLMALESETFRVEAFCGDRPAEMFDSALTGAPSERPLTEVALEPRKPRTVWLVWRGLPADSPGRAQAAVRAIRSEDRLTVRRIDIPLRSLSR